MPTVPPLTISTNAAFFLRWKLKNGTFWSTLLFHKICSTSQNYWYLSLKTQGMHFKFGAQQYQRHKVQTQWVDVKWQLPSDNGGGRLSSRNRFAIWSQAASTGAYESNFTISCSMVRRKFWRFGQVYTNTQSHHYKAEDDGNYGKSSRLKTNSLNNIFKAGRLQVLQINFKLQFFNCDDQQISKTTNKKKSRR